MFQRRKRVEPAEVLGSLSDFLLFHQDGGKQSGLEGGNDCPGSLRAKLRSQASGGWLWLFSQHHSYFSHDY